VANFLTGIRLLLTIPSAMAFARPEYMSAFLLLALLIVAIATDYFDGIVARRANTASARGQIFDHSTDFLFVTCSLAGAAYAGILNPFLPVFIVVAFSQYVLDSHFYYREKQLHMSYLGRWNGVFYFVPLLLIALSRIDMNVVVNDLFLGLIALLGYLLLLSTVASIIDRGIAPLRVKH
jgi:phosphatidylglycerophosphate synthase